MFISNSQFFEDAVGVDMSRAHFVQNISGFLPQTAPIYGAKTRFWRMAQKDIFGDRQFVKQYGFLVDRRDTKFKSGMGAGQRHRFATDFYHTFIRLVNSGHRFD